MKHTMKNGTRFFPKKMGLLLALAVLAASLAGCSSQKENTVQQTLAFPGTSWDMTPEEAVKALGLKEGEYQLVPDEEPEDLSEDVQILVEDASVFGADGGYRLNFSAQKGNPLSLISVYLVYPEETDMKAVQAEMGKVYGEPTQKGEYNAAWNSQETMYDYLSQVYPDFAAAQEAVDGESFPYGPMPSGTWKEKPMARIDFWDEVEDIPNMLTGVPNTVLFSSEMGYWSQVAEYGEPIVPAEKP